MGTLISSSELAARLDAPEVRIMDCRFSLADDTAGRAAYEAGHIPGARYVDLNRDLSAAVIPEETGRHPLPAREDFAALVGGLGIGNDATVVVYDDGPGAFAARAWWMMRWLGHVDVFVLDGGFRAWVDAGGGVTTDAPTITTVSFGASAPLTRSVTADDLPDRPGLLLDARDPARFRGDAEPIDRVAGHIPGAVCAPFASNLDERGHMKTPAALAQQFAALGVQRETEITCYCGSGVTAAHDILALVHAGYPEPVLYPGSWSEWITDPARPVARGDE